MDRQVLGEKAGTLSDWPMRHPDGDAQGDAA